MGRPLIEDAFAHHVWATLRLLDSCLALSQEQTVNRPWAHLLIDNLQKLDETLELVGV